MKEIILDELCNKTAFSIVISNELSKTGDTVKLKLHGYDNSFRCATELMQIMKQFSEEGSLEEILYALTAVSTVYVNKILYKNIDLYPFIVELSKYCELDIFMEYKQEDTINFNFKIIPAIAKNPRVVVILYDLINLFAITNQFTCNASVDTSAGVFSFTLKKK